MSSEEDTYNTIFKAMQHPIRRRILRMICENPAKYTEIQTELNIDNGLLNYHLDALGSLITKNINEKYTLSDFGKATVNLVNGVEEPLKIRNTERILAHPIQIITLLLGVVLIVSSIAYFDLNSRYLISSGKNDLLGLTNEYLKQSLNQTQASLDKMKILNQLDTSNSLRKLYDIDYNTIAPIETEADSIIFYLADQNSTVHITLNINNDTRLILPLTIQKGDATDPDDATESVISRPDLKYAPVLWSMNISYATSNYGRLDQSIPLRYSGWYTLNLNGIRFLGHPASVPGEIWQNGTATYIPINLHLEMSVSTKDGLFNTFIIREYF